jgi:hypothetical protein
MSNEHGLKKKCDLLLKRMQAAGEPIWYVKLHGGWVFQRVGLPDFLILAAGVLIAVELKHPSENCVASPAQDRQMAHIRNAGGLTWVMNDLEFFRLSINGVLSRVRGAKGFSEDVA